MKICNQCHLEKHLDAFNKSKSNDGYTIEKLAEPKFTVGEQFVTASGKLGKVAKVNPGGNYCVQWIDGRYCLGQPEDTMCKIVWDK